MTAARRTAARPLRSVVTIAVVAVSALTVIEAPSSGASTRSGAAHPERRLNSTSIAAPTDALINYGDSTEISTTLTNTTASLPLVNYAVDLLARPADSSTFSSVGSAVTDATGVAYITMSPIETTVYKWSFVGAFEQHQATSTTGTVQVAQIVHAKLTKHRVRHGKQIEAWGTITPGGKSVELQRLIGSDYKTLPITARVKEQTLPNGETTNGFVLPFTPTKKGAMTLRVIADDDSLNAGNTSKALTLTVT